MIYLNGLLSHDTEKEGQTYFIFQSSAAINYYTLFGRDDYNIICLGGVVNKYGIGQEQTLAAHSYARAILDKIQAKSEINVYYPSDINELIEISSPYSTGQRGALKKFYSIDEKAYIDVERKWGGSQSRIALLRGFLMELEIISFYCKTFYIWGISESNATLVQLLKELGLYNMVAGFLTSNYEGRSEDKKIYIYNKEIIENDAFIFVCARGAYNEIASILKNDGLIENRNFVRAIDL